MGENDNRRGGFISGTIEAQPDSYFMTPDKISGLTLEDVTKTSSLIGCCVGDGN